MKKYYIILSVFIILATYFTYGKVDYSKTAKLTTTGNFTINQIVRDIKYD